MGVEIEFAGLDAHRAAGVLAEALDGEVAHDGPHLAHVTGSPLGELRVELDTRYAHPPDERGGMVDKALETIGARDEAAKLLSAVVPVELVTEPVEPGKAALVDRAVEALRQAGAEGTGGSPLYAFGVHLNIELVHGGPERAMRIAAAYTFAERWLRTRWTVDAARRMTPFIDPYPRGWAVDLAERMVGGRLPELEEFIRLYQVYNPSRNRGLDLWPLLGELAPEAAERLHRRPIKNSRPAFHYRRPDSRVGEPGWSIWHELDRWDLIERIADDPERLERARAASLSVESGRGALSAYMAVFDGLMA